MLTLFLPTVATTLVRTIGIVFARFSLEEFLETVPMEEIVRAFNWVIEKGWVCARTCIAFSIDSIDVTGVLLGYL